MSVGSNSADFPLLVSRSAAGTAINEALRLYVGRGRRYSVKQLSNATGVKDRVIECAMCDPETTEYRHLPPEALLSIAFFLGAEFTSDWLRKAGQGAFALPETDDTPPGMLAADNSDDNATFVRMAIDNKIDGSEGPVARGVGIRMIERGHRIVKLASAA